MERLAEYMLQFAKLLGEPERVHFVDVEPGSAVLRARIEEVAAPKVEQRLADASRGQGDPVALKALQALDDMLANDNAVGQVLDESGAEVIAFQGRNRPSHWSTDRSGRMACSKALSSRLAATASVLRSGCKTTSRSTSTAHPPVPGSRLGKHSTARWSAFRARGNWMRLATGAWLMRSFDIKDFEILDDAPLADVIGRLQGVTGADWGEDPLADLAQLRNGERLR